MKRRLNSSSCIAGTIRTVAGPASRELWVAFICLFALWPNAVRGLGVRVPNQDPEAIARGNAFAATADNPSAIYYNPAGITQLPGANLSVSDLNCLGFNTHYSLTNGMSGNSKFHDLSVPQVYATFTPKEAPLSFGLGIYAPFGLETEYYDNSGFQTLANSAKMTYLTVNPVIAWKVCESLSLAAGPMINWSRIDIKRGLAFPVHVAGEMQPDNFQYTGEGVSFGGNAGILWQPCRYASFGLNYRLPTTMHYSGTSTYGNGNFGLNGSAHTTADFQFPQIISGGISFRPATNWNVEADVDWSDWHTLRKVTLDGSANDAALGALGINSDIVLPFNWHGSWFLETGVTRTFGNGWFVNAGYFYSTETTSDSGFNPAIPDTDLHVGSVGIGRKGEHFDWALAGQIMAGPKRTVANSPPTMAANNDTANGSYQIFIPTISVSLGYHF